MERNFQIQALVLQVKQFGENNRIVTFISKEKGVFDAVLYGGAKSKLRSCVSPYHFGTLWIYSDKQKNSIKITDFEVLKFHLELRENLYKNWCASFCSELCIKTMAANESEKCFRLVNGFLDGICSSTEDECRIAVLRFIWRYLDIMGLQPDCKECVLCGEGLDKSATFSLANNGFICENCTNEGENFVQQNEKHLGEFLLSDESIAFLQSVTYLSPKDARNVKMHYSSTSSLHDFLFFMINLATEYSLKTIELEKEMR